MQGRKMYRWGRAVPTCVRRTDACADTADRSGPSVEPWRIVGLATIMIVLPVAAWACAVCFEGDDALARGLNMSILFLMSMPFAIFGTIFSTIYLTHKRAQRHGSKGLALTQRESAQ